MIRATYVIAQLLFLFALNVLATLASLVQLALNLRLKLLHAFGYSLANAGHLFFLNINQRTLDDKRAFFISVGINLEILTCSLRRSIQHPLDILVALSGGGLQLLFNSATNLLGLLFKAQASFLYAL